MAQALNDIITWETHSAPWREFRSQTTHTDNSPSCISYLNLFLDSDKCIMLGKTFDPADADAKL